MSQEETEQISTLPTEDSALNPFVLVLSGDSTGRLYRLESTTTIVGRAEDADIVLTDRGISRQHAKFTLTPDRQVILSDLDSTNGTFLGTDKIRSCQLFGGERLRFGATVKMKFDYRDPSEEQLIEGVARDPLTGALNRSYFEQRFKEACAKAKRHKSPLSCAFIDADHFKQVNDNNGHAAGDEVLKELVRRVTAMKRQEDTFCRFGGEEFVLLLPDTDQEGALHLMERIRARIADSPFQVEAAGRRYRLPITVSIGVSCSSGSDTFEQDQLLEAADQALYRAKEGGRNQVLAG